VIAPDVASAQRIREAQPRWSVNGLALALVAPLLDRTDLGAWQRGIAALRSSLGGALRAHDFDVTCTSANWLLVDRRGLRSDLAPFGVAVRDCASFGMPGVHRVALPRPEQLDRVIAAFAAVA
jgi:threonine-phosphate decarboxylase